MTDDNSERENRQCKPDVFCLCSGGMDSVAATHFTMTAIERRFQKTPMVIYLDTGLKLDPQRWYVEHLCDEFGWHLWKLRTNENFEDITREHGQPGPGQHSTIYNKLKGRQIDKLTTVAGNPHFFTGIRWGESPEREGTPTVEHRRRAWWHKPIAHWSKLGCGRYIAEHDIPQNPLWDATFPTDCWCGCHGHPEELIEAEAEGFEWFTQKIRELEDSLTYLNGKEETWGWGGLTDDEQKWLEAFNDDHQMMLCGPSCAAKSVITDGGSDER